MLWVVSLVISVKDVTDVAVILCDRMPPPGALGQSTSSKLHGRGDWGTNGTDEPCMTTVLYGVLGWQRARGGEERQRLQRGGKM
jgi:hypothetical protein